jgi:predicted N-acyltransferase
MAAQSSRSGAGSASPGGGEGAYALQIHHAMAEIGREAWDGLEAGGSPFLEWDWLHSLEAAGCAVEETGWSPHHLVIREGERIVAACPLYLKAHSQGEFVFDHQWAYAAHRAGIPYYPKLLVAVPFTPAGGVRILTAPGADRPALIRLVGTALRKLCVEHGLSGVHVNFCTAEEAGPLREAGYMERAGLQYHWENRSYRDFEDYLEQFRSKRRNQIRRERREMGQRGIAIRVLAGEEIADGAIPILYRLYKGHVDKMYWGQLYLTPEFFERLAACCKRNLVFVVAERAGRIVAGTFNVQKDGVFYGRYWGAFEEVPFLHFNVCYYAAIEHCIRAGVRRFEPGAGGDFKRLRGFEPRLTRSMHALHPPELHEAVARFLRTERAQIARAAEFYQGRSALKPRQAAPD